MDPDPNIIIGPDPKLETLSTAENYLHLLKVSFYEKSRSNSKVYDTDFVLSFGLDPENTVRIRYTNIHCWRIQ